MPDRSKPLEGATPRLTAALIVRFLLELALLTGAAVVAWTLVPGGWRWATVFGVPVLLALLWGAVLAPRAPLDVGGPVRVCIELVLFAAVGAGLWISGFPAVAVVGVTLWLLDRVAIARWGRDRSG